MSNSIGPVHLPDGNEDATGAGFPEWVDERQWQPMAAQEQRTLGGVNHIRQAPLSGGRKITLLFEESAWLSKETGDELIALASVPGAYQVTLGPISMVGAFDHSSGPAVELTPVWVNCDEAYTGSAKLIEVA